MQLSPEPKAAAPRWQTLSAIDRRVVGVLVEKAKTTPDAYPLSINAICTGANQKNNRAPLMNLEVDDLEPSLERLRALGAVGEIQGSGRVSKYRHYLYDWLGVDKLEMAVMAELLLRGPQTEGELRGRAARMESIADLAALRPILERLKAKRLVLPLSPPGRGQMITHALYPSGEWEKLKAQFAALADEDPNPAGEDRDSPAAAATTVSESRLGGFGPPRTTPPTDDVGALRREVSELRQQTAQLREDIGELVEKLERYGAEVDRLRTTLGE